MSYRSESEALRARADSLEQELRRQKVEVAEGRAAKARVQALEQQLEEAQARLARLERPSEPKVRGKLWALRPALIFVTLVFAVGVGALVVFAVLDGGTLAPERKAAAPTQPAAAAVGHEAPTVTYPTIGLEGLPRTSVSKSGELFGRSIRLVLKRQVPQLQRCYQRTLPAHADLQGTLVLEWTVGPDGAVKAAKLESSTGGVQALASCVLALLRTWRFPRPTEDVVVSYPLVFSMEPVGR